MSPLRQQIRNLIFRLMYYMGLHRVLLLINNRAERVPILLYHRVSPHGDRFWDPLLPEVFETHIRFLSTYYRFISLDDLIRLSPGQLRNTCAVVFDDGFTDFFEHALPIIRRYSVPVSMFVPVDCVDRNQVVWTSQLYNCFKFTDRTQFDLEMQGRKRTFVLAGESDRIKAAEEVLEFLKQLPDSGRISRLEWLKEELGYREDVHVTSMTWPQITETRTEISYQSHTMTHPRLSRVENQQATGHELEDSRSRLAEVLGTDIKYIAYPLGDWTPEIVDQARRSYQAGFAVGNQLVDLKRLSDPVYRYAIPRFNIHDVHPHELIFRINGFHSLFTRPSL